MPPKIIGIVGHIRAGKTTASAYLVKNYGYKLASNSDVLREIATKIGLPHDRETLKRLGDAVFSSLGNDAIARHRIKNSESYIVVDGIRYPEEIEAYSEEPTFRLIGMFAPIETRHQRAIATAKDGKDRLQTLDEFGQLDLARSEECVPEIMKGAHKIIVNDMGIDGLERALDQFLKGNNSMQEEHF
jgi:dephospho-CoA kinase